MVLVAGVALQLEPAVAGDGVTMYEVIAEPPLSDGGSNVTVILAPETVATTFAGAEGTPAGVAGELDDDCAEVAIVVTAATLKV